MCIRKILALSGLCITLFTQVLWAGVTELRYIRIGEHADHTRLVFEFTELPVFEEPAVTDDRTISVTFTNTSTVLPGKIPGETTNRIKSLQFLETEGNLTAQVNLSFLHPKLNTFPLTDPPRMVIDIRQIDEEKGIGASTEPAHATSQPNGQIAGEPISSRQESPPVAAGPLPKGTVDEAPVNRATIVGAARDEHMGGQADLNHKPDTAASNRKKREPVAGNVGRTIPAETGLWGTNLQLCLLAVLTVLSLSIVGLLFTLVRKRNRLPNGGNGPLELENDRATGEKIQRIDGKIEEALKRMDQY